MKLLSVATAMTLTFATATTMAKTVVLKPLDQNLETQACYTAATQGIDAAKTLVKEHNIRFSLFKNTVTCNGLRLVDFAHEFGEQEEKSGNIVTRIALVAVNTNVESQLCLDAVTMGEKKARNKHDIYAPVICNNLNLPDFVRSFKKREIVEHKIAE